MGVRSMRIFMIHLCPFTALLVVGFGYNTARLFRKKWGMELRINDHPDMTSAISPWM